VKHGTSSSDDKGDRIFDCPGINIDVRRVTVPSDERIPEAGSVHLETKKRFVPNPVYSGIR
jgi:hypothetical protein